MGMDVPICCAVLAPVSPPVDEPLCLPCGPSADEQLLPTCFRSNCPKPCCSPISDGLQPGQESIGDIPIVGNVRGHGLMAAVEMTVRGENEQDLLEKDYAIGELVDKHCQKLGLLVRPFINICIISPPLIITKKEIDNLVSILRKGLELTMRDLEEIGVSL